MVTQIGVTDPPFAAATKMPPHRPPESKLRSVGRPTWGSARQRTSETRPTWCQGRTVEHDTENRQGPNGPRADPRLSILCGASGTILVPLLGSHSDVRSTSLSQGGERSPQRERQRPAGYISYCFSSSTAARSREGIRGQHQGPGELGRPTWPDDPPDFAACIQAASKERR